MKKLTEQQKFDARFTLIETRAGEQVRNIAVNSGLTWDGALDIIRDRTENDNYNWFDSENIGDYPEYLQENDLPVPVVEWVGAGWYEVINDAYECRVNLQLQQDENREDVSVFHDSRLYTIKFEHGSDQNVWDYAARYLKSYLEEINYCVEDREGLDIVSAVIESVQNEETVLTREAKDAIIDLAEDVQQDDNGNFYLRYILPEDALDRVSEFILEINLHSAGEYENAEQVKAAIRSELTRDELKNTHIQNYVARVEFDGATESYVIS